MNKDLAKAIETVESESKLDNGSLFTNGKVNPEEIPIPGATKKTNYTYCCQVFIIFRPFSECPQCAADIRTKKGDEPVVVSFLSCPHVEKNEYVHLINRCIKKEAVLIERATETLKDGTMIATVEWYEFNTQKETRAFRL